MESTKMNYKLTRISGGHSLRTSSVIGKIHQFPWPGQALVMAGEGIEFGIRLVNTSPAVEVEILPKYVTFLTKSGSKYKLEKNS